MDLYQDQPLSVIGGNLLDCAILDSSVSAGHAGLADAAFRNSEAL